jgi:endonuclease/exonuclease/phosphatase family metal-dependent hydrolase
MQTGRKRPQHEFLAEDFWMQTAYGGNAVYDHGHHGNAILSRYPILSAHNQDISDHMFERRGLLHCEIALPGRADPVHCACIHLGLTGGTRRRQMQAIVDRMHTLAGGATPLIIAGDFNDWRNRADDQLCDSLGVVEAFAGERGRPARSFPATLPVLRLDRIYVRGFRVESAQSHYACRGRRFPTTPR